VELAGNLEAGIDFMTFCPKQGNGGWFLCISKLTTFL